MAEDLNKVKKVKAGFWKYQIIDDTQKIHCQQLFPCTVDGDWEIFINIRSMK